MRKFILRLFILLVVPAYSYSQGTKNYFYVQEFSGINFGQRLQRAIDQAPDGAVIDGTTFRGSQIATQTIHIRKGCKILFPRAVITWIIAADSHAVVVKANNVFLEGQGRSPKKDLLIDGTRLVIGASGKGYHIYVRGKTDFSSGYNCITISNMDMIGVQSTIYTRNGSGGIFLSEPDPGVSGGGNNINQVRISNVLISGTKDHAIFIVGGILSIIENSRVSDVGGHGFYTTGSSTSTSYINCYASSGHLAGFCLDGNSYSALFNCGAENFGIGYWFKACFNITGTGLGAESNQTRSTGSAPNNLGIILPNSLGGDTINDIGADNTQLFKGTSYLVTGGRNVYLSTPFSKDPGQAFSGASSTTRHYDIRGNARSIYLIGPRCFMSGDATGTPRFDISLTTVGSDSPRDCNIWFNPYDDGTRTPTIAGGR